MNEELLSILQQIQETQDKLLDAQSPIASGVWAILGATIVAIMALVGVILTARAAEKRQRNELEHDRERQGRDEHREKLEEALQMLLALRVWGTDIVTQMGRISFPVDQNTVDFQSEFQLLIDIRGEGESKYGMVLTILDIYSDINDADLRLTKPFLDFKNGATKELRLPITGVTPEDFEGQILKLKALNEVCDGLVKEVRKEIRDNYMPLDLRV